MLPHLALQSGIIVPRIFTNICQVCDVLVNVNDYSIRARTYAAAEAIPRGLYIGIRKRETNGAPFLNIWPLWICVEVLPPGGPLAIQLHRNGN